MENDPNRLFKVLYLINHAGKAGTEAYLMLLAGRMHGVRIEASLAYNEEGWLVGRISELGIRTYKVRMRSPFDLAAAWKLSRICRSAGIEIIHTHYLRENYIALLSRLFNPKVKVIYTNHFILPNNLMLKICNRFITRLQTRIIAVCGKGRDMLVKNGNDQDKITVIYNGVDPIVWGRKANAPEATCGQKAVAGNDMAAGKEETAAPGYPDSTLRGELGIGDDVFIILCASRFAYDKGHDFLVKSIAELRKTTNRKFKCVLANDGPFYEQIRELVRSMDLENEIIFIGPRKDMKNVYDGCDMYVNSSWHEALSFAIVEALAEGLPVVATDKGGNPEIINDETKCGILVPYGEPEALAAAIRRVMDDGELRRELSFNALKTVREKFSLDKMIAETYNQYVKSIC